MQSHRCTLRTESPLLFGVAALLCCVVGCDESVNPSVPFQPRMVVYSVLTTESDTQYVRVYSTYIPRDNDPSKNLEDHPVTDATVTISSDSVLHQFHKTSFERLDKSRYSSAIVGYVAYPFRPARGKAYRLSVSSATIGAVTAVTTVPASSQVSPINFFCLCEPYRYRSWNYGVEASLSSQARAFLARIYVEYLASTPQGWQLKRLQIPIAMKTISKLEGTWKMFYPVVQRRGPGARVSQAFRTGGWINLLEDVIWASDGDGVRFLHVLFKVIQFDGPLYDYYGIANLFRDRNSVRLDEADYANISGGIGIFGSLAVDSVTYALPETITRPPPK